MISELCPVESVTRKGYLESTVSDQPLITSSSSEYSLQPAFVFHSFSEILDVELEVPLGQGSLKSA